MNGANFTFVNVENFSQIHLFNSILIHILYIKKRGGSRQQRLPVAPLRYSVDLVNCVWTLDFAQRLVLAQPIRFEKSAVVISDWRG